MIAEVVINRNVKKLNKTFDYQIPEELQDQILIGSRVFVPFGNQKEPEEGFVVGIKETTRFQVKTICSVEGNRFLNQEDLELAKWMEKRYFCNLADCMKLLLPPGVTTKEIENRVKEKKLKFVRLNKETEEIEEEIKNRILKSEKQIQLIRFLMENGETLITEVEELSGVSRAVMKTLEKNGYVTIFEKQVERNPFLHKVVQKTGNLPLTEEQQNAFRQIADAMDDCFFSEFLLEGVTGSGKTEVYLQLIQKCLQEGKSSILLVPEISLTPQTVDRFLARFGDEKIAVLHSKLSIGERYDSWNKIKQGRAQIIIGARSAIFAPAQNLGLIIIDEEHDDSYKSEMTPRYQAKEVARYLTRRENIPLVYGSATPALETRYRAQKEEICLLKLTKRANQASMPKVEIVDLRQELARGNHSMLSQRLFEEMQENLERKKQTILFLNRRGFSTFVMCRDCGYTAKCKNCDISLTYHRKEEKLKCHYCGYETNLLQECPECKSKNIRYFGTGTQKLEEEIQKRFPGARTIRMDIDTVTKKNSHEEILNKFREEHFDILIGTQMVVKGHHFPDVTLVGVIAADSNLNMGDFRATEKTFQILTQVAGRAGREKEPGRVIIQTYNPDNFSIQCAKEQDYDVFYQTEMELRKQLKNPPFCDIIVIGIHSENLEYVQKVSQKLYQVMKKQIQTENLPVILYSPLPAPVDRIKNKIRWRMLLKCKFEDWVADFINQSIQICEQELKQKDLQKTNIVVDLNPTNMM